MSASAVLSDMSNGIDGSALPGVVISGGEGESKRVESNLVGLVPSPGLLLSAEMKRFEEHDPTAGGTTGDGG